MTRLAGKTIRASLALLLTLGISGAGCMFGCGEMMAATASDPTAALTETGSFATIVSGDACASQGSHDCCAKKKSAVKKAERPATAKLSLQTAALVSLSQSLKPEPGRGMTECPLATSRAVAITRGRDHNPQVTAILLPSNPATLPAVSEFHSTVAPIARLPNRGHTYLRCCAFLI